MRRPGLPLFAMVIFQLAGVFLPAQDRPAIQEEVLVRWWLVPVYAMNKDGRPALGLKPADFEVFLDDRPIPYFDLHVREYQVAPADTPSSGEGLIRRFEGKLVFLVFDSAFSSFEVLEKAKAVAEAMMAHEGEGAQFLALSIEPFRGLQSIAGPTRDRALIARSIDRHVSGKKAAYLRNSAADSNSIRNVYPEGDRRNPDELWTPGRRISRLERLDTAETRRIAAVYTRALLTVNLILGAFKNNSKVVYLFSCGIPQTAMDWKTEGVVDPSGGLAGGEEMYVNARPDAFNRQALTDIARTFNRNGSLLFLINPLGARLALSENDSGERSLRLLADESGGRYYDGPERDIIRQIAGMEKGYYEISFPDSPEYRGGELDLKIRARRPGVDIFSVKRVSRGADYSRMSGPEREVLILGLLERGPFAQSQLRIIEGQARIRQEGKRRLFAVRLPPALERTGWDIYRVWRNPEAGKIILESGRVVSESEELTIDMRLRTGFVHEVVLVHAPSGTALVFQK